MCNFSTLYSLSDFLLQRIAIELGIINSELLNMWLLNILPKILLVLTSLVRIIFSYWLYLIKTLAVIYCSQRHKMKESWGWPSGTAVKCTRSTSAARGSPLRILGADMAPLGMPCCGRHSMYKVEDGPGC